MCAGGYCGVRLKHISTEERSSNRREWGYGADTPHGKVEPVGQKRVGRVSEHSPHVRGVNLRRVEVRVVADPRRQVHLHLVHRDERRGAQLCVVPDETVVG